jgi:Peptidase A4 family
MGLARCLIIAGSAAAMAGSLVLGGEAAVTTLGAAPARPASAQPSTRFLAEARAALARYLRSSNPANTQPGGHDVAPGRPAARSTMMGTTGSDRSYNWSGYADLSTKAGTFTGVSGQWRTPRVHCTREDEISSAWVGLDGFTNATVEQAGTVSWCFKGVPTYYTWYEMVPAGTIEVGKSLRPGDRITARISRSGTSYTLSLTDATRPGNGFSVTKKCKTCQDTSAEWITERPDFTTTGIVPLANYSFWGMSDATAAEGRTTGTISSFASSYKITMVDSANSYDLSVPSPLGDGGARFSTRWLDSY